MRVGRLRASASFAALPLAWLLVEPGKELKHSVGYGWGEVGQKRGARISRCLRESLGGLGPQSLRSCVRAISACLVEPRLGVLIRLVRHKQKWHPMGCHLLFGGAYRNREALYADWQAREPEAEWKSKWWFADAVTIRANDFNLSAGRYRPMSQVAIEHRDTRELLDKLAAIEAEIVEEVEALRVALAEQAA